MKQCGIVTNLGEILSDPYKSEVNVSISWLWDARTSRRLKGGGEKMVGRRFDLWLEEHGKPSNFRRALTDVTETAYLVKLWFDDYGVFYTAADLVAMTAMVLQREQDMRGSLVKELSQLRADLGDLTDRQAAMEP